MDKCSVEKPNFHEGDAFPKIAYHIIQNLLIHVR